ncbi:ricin-type beta-trefoil lectin domain protein [Streptomyces sp. NPDC056652]|uniref:ricin-type beta-trefoil lectin domain protein n=1 Tax=Streptomyces sp. NPDC056652 TaxID=3345893 RepID=UPI0036A9D504
MPRPHPTAPPPARARLGRRVGTWMLAVLAVLVLVPLKTVSDASPAAADTRLAPGQFQGVHWSRLGDNFTFDRLVLQGLSPNDDYNSARTKADGMFAAFQSTLGANTVRLPMNPATASWNTYNAVIDAATARGFKVVLSYWSEDGSNRVTDSYLPTWNRMWDTVIARYLANPLVYFDPMNEPVGFTTAEWLNFAANWITRASAAGLPRDRMFIEGAQIDGGGWGSDLRPLCDDSRFNGVYLAMHRYAFPYEARTYAYWVNDIKTLMGNCTDRTVIEEFGADADNGIDYDATPSATTPKEVAFLRAITDVIHDYGLGAIWCHGIGGRTTSPDHDSLNILRLFSAFGGGTQNLPLWEPNPTAVNRLLYAFGTSRSSTTRLRNVGYDACLDVPGASQANDVRLQVAGCGSGGNQRWTRKSNGQISVYDGTKCLDAFGFGKTNGTPVVSHDCTGNSNQRWYFFSDGTVRGADSRLCLDADLAGRQNVQLWSCGNGDNQKWRPFQGVPRSLAGHTRAGHGQREP